MIKEVICFGCDEKCVLDIDKFDDNLEISGNKCDVGIKTAEAEFNSSKGILTTMVRIKGAKCNVVSVKTTKPIDKELWVECSKALSRIYVGAPINIGDTVCKNILNTGADIICTKKVKKN